ncbi:hypothetical protein D3C72_2562890 [compost metagenome]
MLLWRLDVGDAGHYVPVAADRRSDMMNAVDNGAGRKLRQNDIAVPAHQLNNDFFGGYIS